MKARKWTALALTLLLLFGMLPTVTARAEDGVLRPTAKFCPFSATGKHNWSGWYINREPTCTSKGERWRTCENGCGYEQTDSIPRLDHKWSSWKTTREATCTSAGEQTRTCKNCGRTDTRALDKLAHSYGGWTVTQEATCTQTGSRTRTCKVCGHEDQDTIARLPHTWGEWQITTEATDHSAGERAHTCEVCGTSETESFDPEGTLRRGAKGEAVKALQEGLICYGVLKAGGADGSFGPGTESAVKQAQEAEGLIVDGIAWPQTQAVLGHQFGEWEVVSVKTDFSIGLRTRTCARCGLIEEEEDVPSPMYRRGDKGDGVKALQEALNAAGFDCGKADGSFGGKTEAAVTAFEEAHGIHPDGIAWPGVLKLLNGEDDIDYGDIDYSFAPGLSLTSGAVSRTGEGFNESILVDMTLENTGDVALGVNVANADWAGGATKDRCLGWPEGAKDLQTDETFTFQYQIFLTEKDLEAGRVLRTLTVMGLDGDRGLYAGDSVVLDLPLYGEADTGRIQLTAGNTWRGASEDAEFVTQLTVSDLGKTDLDVWVRVKGLDEDMTIFGSFGNWPEDGEGSVHLVPGEEKGFEYMMDPTAQELQNGWIERTVTAEGIDPVSEQGFVSSAVLRFPLKNEEQTAILHLNGFSDPAHGDGYEYSAGDELHLDYIAVNYSNVDLCNAQMLCMIFAADGSCLHKETLYSDEYGDRLDADEFGGMLRYTITDEAVAAGPLTVISWAQAEREDVPGELVRSNIWRTIVPTYVDGEIPAGGDADALIVTLQADERPYTAGETVQVAIQVKNAGSLPMTQLSVSALVYDYAAGEYGVGEVLEDLGDAEFLPGDMRELTYPYPVTDADVERGELLLTICADARTEAEWLTTTADLHLDTYEIQDAGSDEGMVVSGYQEKETFAPGETLTVHATITNTGDETIEVYDAHSEIMLPDNPYEYLVGIIPQEGWKEIKPGGSRNATATYDVTDEDVERGRIVLSILVKARGVDSGKELDDGVSFYFTLEEGEADKPMGALALRDVTAEDRAYAAGETVEVHFTIENTGAEPLENLLGQLKRVEGGDQIDELETPIYADPATTLAPGATVDVVLPHTVTEKEAEKGYIQLLVRAEGTSTGVGSYCADAVELVLGDSSKDPKFRPVKLDLPALIVAAELTDPDRAYAAGEKVPMDITVVCANSTPLDQFEVWLEPMYPGTDFYIYEYIEGVGNLDTYDLETGLIGLDPGEVWEVHHDELVFPEVVAALGSFDVDVVARARDPETGEYCEVRDRITVKTKEGPGEAALQITAKARAEKFAPFVPLKIDVRVENTGSVPIKGISAYLEPGSDGNADGKAPPFASWSGEILPGVAWNTSFVYTPTLEDVDKSQLHFTFMAESEHPETDERVEDGVELYVLRSTDALGLDFKAEPLDGEEFLPGKTVFVELTATNTGTVPLKRLLVDDELPSQATFGSIDELLMPGKSCTALVPVHPSKEDWYDNPNGWGLSWTLNANAATTGAPLEVTAHITLMPAAEEPELTVTVVPESKTFAPFVPVHYVITAENTGNVALEGVQLLHAAPYMKLTPDKELMKPGEKRTFEWSVVLTFDDISEASVHTFSFTAAGYALGSGQYVEDSDGFELTVANNSMYKGSGLTVHAKEAQEGLLYVEKQTAWVDVHLKNDGGEPVQDIIVVVQRMKKNELIPLETTVVPLTGAVLEPGQSTTYHHPYVITRADVIEDYFNLRFTVLSVGALTGESNYAYDTLQLKTKTGSAMGYQTAVADVDFDYDGDWQLDTLIPVNSVKPQFGLELAVTEVTCEDDIVTAKIWATNQSDVSLTRFRGAAYDPNRHSDFVGEVGEFLLPMNGGGAPLEDADIELAPGESFEFIYRTGINNLDYAYYDVLTRGIGLTGYGEDDVVVVGMCWLRLPLEVPEEMGFRLSLGNYVRDQQQNAILQKLRLENPTDEVLEIHMSIEAYEDPTEDETSFQWQGSGSGVYFVDPGKILDFGVWLQPTEQEAEGGIILRAITAAGGDEERGVIVGIPLWAEGPGEALEIACEAAGLEGGAVKATYSVLSLIPGDVEGVFIRDARVKVQVLAPDGSCLDTLTLTPEETEIRSGESAAAHLQYELKPEQAALGSLTFLAWAEGVVFTEGEDGLNMPVLSWNIWTETVATDGMPEVVPGDLSVSLSLPDGDRLYRAGEPIPLAFEVAPIGDHALEGLQVWFEPVETGTDSFIYEDFGDLMLDTSLYAEGFGPGSSLSAERYEKLTLPLEAAQAGGFDMDLNAGATDPVTGEYFERSARVHVRTVDNPVGLVMILEPDASKYQNVNVPIVFRVGIKNEGDVPFDGVHVYCRRGTLAQANVPNWVEVVFETDEPIQPGETVWREDFRCWPTVELEGGLMYAHFTAYTWAGREHATTERMLEFPMVQPAGISLSGEPDSETFVQGQRVDYPVTVKNTGGAALVNCFVTHEVIPAQGEASQMSFPLFQDNRFLWPGEKKEMAWYYESDGSEGDSVTLKIIVTGQSTDTGETVTDEWTRTLTRDDGGAVDSDAIALTGVPETFEYTPGVPYSIPVVVENIGSQALTDCCFTVSTYNGEAMVGFAYFWLVKDGATLEPAGTIEFPREDTPDSNYKTGTVLQFEVVAKVAETGEEVRCRKRCVLLENEADEALTVECALEEDRIYAADETAYVTVTVRNDGEAPLGVIELDVDITRFGSDALEKRMVGDWDAGLEPGQEIVCVFDYTFTQEDVDSGAVHLNFKAAQSTQEVSAKHSEASCVLYTRDFGSDTINYNLPPETGGPGDSEAGMFVAVEVDVGGYAEGDNIHYDLELVNSGSVNLTQVSLEAVQADEDHNPLATLPVASWPDCDLAPDGTLIAAWDHGLTAEDLARGLVRFTFVAKGYAVETGEPAASECGNSVYLNWFLSPDEDLAPGGQMVVVKARTVGQPAYEGGYRLNEIVNYVIEVTNPGQDTADKVEIWDDDGDEAPELVRTLTLAPGETAWAYCQHRVTEEDVQAGSHDNTAYAAVRIHDLQTGEIVNGYTSWAEAVTVPVSSEPIPAPETFGDFDYALSIKEASAPEHANGYRLGEVVRYDITVTSLDADPINGIYVGGSLAGYDEETGDTLLGKVALAPYAAATLTFPHVVNAQDVQAGVVAGLGYCLLDVQGEDEDVTDVVRYTDPVPVKVSQEAPETGIGGPGDEDEEDGDGASLTIEKRVVGGSEYEEGYHLFEYINYEIAVTNNSPDGVRVEVFDECAGTTPDALGAAWILPGECATFPYAFEVGKEEVMAGSVENVCYANITHITEGSTAFSVGETYYAVPVTVPTTYRQPDPQPRPDEYRVEVRKNALGKPENGDAYRLGEVIYYEIIVTNPTDNAIHAAWIFDELSGYADQPECLGCLTLNFGQSARLTYSHTVTEQDVAAGQVENKAWALLAVINEAGDVEDAVFESDVVTVTTTDAPPETIIPPATLPPEIGQPEPKQPEPTPAASDTSDASFCERRLTGRGEGISRYELTGCGEHRQVLEAFAAAQTAANDGAAALLQWQAVKGLLQAAVHEEYDRLADALPDEAARALLAADRDSFLKQLETLEALLSGTANPAAAARLVSEQLADNLIDLCCARRTAPGPQPDSLLEGGYARLAGAEDMPDGCRSEYSGGVEGQPLTRTETLCPAHAAIDQKLDAAISAQGASEASPEAFRQAQKAWEAALRALGRGLARSAEEGSRDAITADLFAFHDWQVAREALLGELYPDSSLAATELLMSTIRRRVIGMEAAIRSN